MNLFKTKFSIHLACLTVLLAGTFNFSKAQGPTSVGFNIASCYHVLPPSNDNVTYNVLNMGAFHFNYSTNMGAIPDRIRIQTFDENGSQIPFDYAFSGLSDKQFPVIYHPDYSYLASTYAYDIETNEFILNHNVFHFDQNVKSVVVTGYHWIGDPGEQVLEANNYNINLNFLTVDEAFDFHSNNDQCFTFDNFNISYTTSLDGFCNNLTVPTLSIIGPPAALLHFDPNTEIDVEFNELKQLNLQLGGTNTDNWCEEQCFNNTAPYNHPSPVACGCAEFVIKFKLQPCPHAPAECEEIELQKTINICCDCDIREQGPSN